MATWKAAEFRPVGHIIFRKSYASSTRFVRYISVEPTSGYGGQAECLLSERQLRKAAIQYVDDCFGRVL